MKKMFFIFFKATKVEAVIERLNISGDSEIVDLLENLKSRGYIVEKVS